VASVPAAGDADRIRGGLLGLAVGDALGAPLEGAPPTEAAAATAAGLEMGGGGWWRAGEWTDDTAMALALAESIAARGLLDSDDVARRYIAWATTDGKGIGRATRRALVRARDAADARARARSYFEATGMAAGNGTLMRAGPIGLAAGAIPEAVEAARRDAVLTHADPVAGAASGALCAALVALRAGREPLAAARERVPAHPRLDATLEAVAAHDLAAVAEPAAGPEAGACWTTLGVAFAALEVGDDYARGVTWAIGLGGDTDTNAAVAGALLGCRHGPRSIPPRWAAPLHQLVRIERAAAGLVAVAAGRPAVRSSA
jgi:ADP-ribosyl-[dinitrogen reductase] hydrolase